MLEELKKLRLEHLEVQEKYSKLKEKFENEVKLQLKKISKHFSELWKPIKINTLYVTSDNNEWNPHILYWFKINNIEINFNTKLGWFTSDNYDATIYNSTKFEIPANIDISLLENSLSRILKCKPYEKQIREKTDRIKSFDDIKLYLGNNIELLDYGEIWYTGWDIKDVFFIIKSEDLIKIFYSTNSHGFGCEHELPEKNTLEEDEFDKNTEKLVTFFKYLDTNNLPFVRKKWETKILENWKNQT